MNRQSVLYIAMSLDGFIARKDDDISWLSMVETPGEDYGYSDFVKGVDTVFMGRKTYEKVLSFGIEFPHKNRLCYVITKTPSPPTEYVEFYNDDPVLLLREQKSKPGGTIFIDGGAELVNYLLGKNEIDSYIISIIPLLLGSGIPLFKEGNPEIPLKLTRCTSFPSGLVQLWYSKK